LSEESEEKIEELYLYEILNGKVESGFKGLIPLMNEYMSVHNFDKEKVAKIQVFLDFLLQRAKGEMRTGARFIRDLVKSNPNYK